jgi:hypothetical protein
MDGIRGFAIMDPSFIWFASPAKAKYFCIVKIEASAVHFETVSLFLLHSWLPAGKLF